VFQPRNFVKSTALYKQRLPSTILGFCIFRPNLYTAKIANQRESPTPLASGCRGDFYHVQIAKETSSPGGLPARFAIGSSEASGDEGFLCLVEGSANVATLPQWPVGGIAVAPPR
jgi:hypothetical protein